MGKRDTLLRMLVVVLLFVLAGGLISAESPVTEADDQRATAQAGDGVEPLGLYDAPYQYMVKFVCGDTLPDAPSPMVRGYYFTAINIGNYTGQVIRIYYRPLEHYAPWWGGVAPFVHAVNTYTIKPRTDLELDCGDVWNALGLNYFAYAKGIMHISVPVRLPVVAVYTVGEGYDVAGAAADYRPKSIDVEYIEPFIQS